MTSPHAERLLWVCPWCGRWQVDTNLRPWNPDLLRLLEAALREHIDECMAHPPETPPGPVPGG